MTPWHISRYWRPWSGLTMLVALMMTPLRPALESSMSLHMLIQYPALMVAGSLLADITPAALSRRLVAWNTLGISGLTAVALILAVLMIPRLLDLALVDGRVEMAKAASLVLAGAVLLPSWRAAGQVIQGFFLGNLLPMTVVVGSLYQSAPLRLCNAYLLDDQRQLGQALIWIAVALASVWLTRLFWRHVRFSDTTTPASPKRPIFSERLAPENDPTGRRKD